MARPLPVIPGVVRVTVRGSTAYGTRWTNVLHFKRGTGDPGPADYPALVTQLNKLYTGPAYTTGVGLIQYCLSTLTLQDYTFESLAAGIASPTLAATGSPAGAGTSTPAEVAAVLSMRTANRGKRYRGRIYLPGPTMANLTANGNFAAGMATQLPQQCQDFNTAIQGLATPYSWVVASYGYSKLKNGTISTWAAFATPVTSWSLDLIPDVQRRRKS